MYILTTRKTHHAWHPVSILVSPWPCQHRERRSLQGLKRCERSSLQHKRSARPHRCGGCFNEAKMRFQTEKMVLKQKYVEKTNMLNLKLRDSRESEHIFGRDWLGWKAWLLLNIWSTFWERNDFRWFFRLDERPSFIRKGSWTWRRNPFRKRVGVISLDCNQDIWL